MKVLSWGTFPSYEEFVAAFLKECPSGWYEIRHGSVGKDPRPPAGDYMCRELWDELYRLWRLSGFRPDEDDPASWVADILWTLGFEWI